LLGTLLYLIHNIVAYFICSGVLEIHQLLEYIMLKSLLFTKPNFVSFVTHHDLLPCLVLSWVPKYEVAIEDKMSDTTIIGMTFDMSGQRFPSMVNDKNE
jgi:hypothetical protein